MYGNELFLTWGGWFEFLVVENQKYKLPAHLLVWSIHATKPFQFIKYEKHLEHLIIANLFYQYWQ